MTKFLVDGEPKQQNSGVYFAGCYKVDVGVDLEEELVIQPYLKRILTQD